MSSPSSRRSRWSLPRPPPPPSASPHFTSRCSSAGFASAPKCGSGSIAAGRPGPRWRVIRSRRSDVHHFELRVRYGDTDQMGFAYYANYLRWFEIGRAEMMRAMGKSYRELEESGVSLPVMEAWCRYREPARYDDALAIETGILRPARA